MSDWKRNDSIRLGEIAYQVGLTPEDADTALTLGARFLAHGFTGAEIDRMILAQYRTWAEEENGGPLDPEELQKTRQEMGFG